MKVVLAICGTGHYCGLPKYFYFLAKHLVKSGIEVELVTDSIEGIKHLLEISKGVPILLKTIKPVCQEKFSTPATALWCWRVAQYLRNKDFDILHCGHVTPYFYLRQKDRKPIVFQPFGNELIAFERFESYKGIAKYFYTVTKGILEYCGKKCDVLLAEEDWQLEEMKKFYGREDSIILPVGIDIDFVNENAKRGQYTRHKLGIREEEFVTITVNTFHPHKDYPNLIKALAYLPKNFKSILVGSGPESDKCKRLIKELRLGNRIYWEYNIPEEKLYGLYRLADCYVSPTQCTDFQMGIMEAEASGLPIISTAQDFQIDGNGFITGMNNPRALAGRILDMARTSENNRNLMGKKSLAIVKQWDFRKIAKKAIVIYKELLNCRNN